MKDRHDEELLVWKIKRDYFSQCSPLNTIGEIPNNILNLFKPCKKSAIYDKQIMTERGAMASLDFNNDGISDFVQMTGVSTYSWPVGVDPVKYEVSGAQDAPHLVDPTKQHPAVMQHPLMNGVVRRCPIIFLFGTQAGLIITECGKILLSVFTIKIAPCPLSRVIKFNLGVIQQLV